MLAALYTYLDEILGYLEKLNVTDLYQVTSSP